MAIDQEFGLDWGGGDVRYTRAIYVPPLVHHSVAAPGVRWVVIYLEPGSYRDLSARRADPQPLIGVAESVAAGGVMGGLEELGPRGRPAGPVSDVLDRALDSGRWPSAAEAAVVAGYSTAHFLRIFANATGTSYRRFGLWIRLLEVTRRLPATSLTEAAADASFSSPSHLSDPVRAVVGFTATELLGTG